MRAKTLATGIIVGAAGYSGILLVYALSKGAPVYYTVSLALLLVLPLLSIRLAANRRMNVAVLLASTGLSLLVVEAVLFATDDRKHWDDRTQLQVLADLRDEGIEAQLPVGPKHHWRNRLEVNGERVYPWGGISNATHAWCNETGDWVLYESDEHGFNNPKGIWARDSISIVAVGDSFTHGACVEPEEGFVGVIRAEYENTLNLGYGGNDPYMELATMKEYVGDLKPRMVLWFYFEGNDIAGIQATTPFVSEGNFVSSIFSRYLETTYKQHLSTMQEGIDRSLRELVSQRILEGPGMPVGEQFEPADRSAFRALIETASLHRLRNRLVNQVMRQKVETDDVPFGAPLWTTTTIIQKPTTDRKECLHYDYNWSPSIQGFERVLGDAREFVRSWNGELYFVYLPSIERYYGPIEDCEWVKWKSMVDLYDEIMEMVQDVGLPIIDVTKAFDRNPDPRSLWPFRKGGHYAKDGHRTVAEAVLAALPSPETLARRDARTPVPYLPGKLVPVGPPAIDSVVVDGREHAIIRWPARNSGDTRQYGFIVVGTPATPVTNPIEGAIQFAPGDVKDITIDLDLDLPPGTYTFKVTIGDTGFTDTVTLTVRPSASK